MKNYLFKLTEKYDRYITRQ